MHAKGDEGRFSYQPQIKPVLLQYAEQATHANFQTITPKLEKKSVFFSEWGMARVVEFIYLFIEF